MVKGVRIAAFAVGAACASIAGTALAQVTSVAARPHYAPNALGLQSDSSVFEGHESGYLSGNGRYVVFLGQGNLTAENAPRLLRKDIQTGAVAVVAGCAPNVLAGPGSSPLDRRSISQDGAVVAFVAASPCIAAGSSPSRNDVFVRDFATGTLSRVSVTGSGAGEIAANGDSGEPWVSADGRYVVFVSEADNLVAGDSNGRADVFLRDRVAQVTERISVASGGVQSVTGTTVIAPLVSADGRYVAFTSDATDLVVDDSNVEADVFLHDRQTDQTVRVSVGVGGVQAAGRSRMLAFSSNGSVVVFSSTAANLTAESSPGLFVRDRVANSTEMVNVNDAGVPASSTGIVAGAGVSADGRYVVFDSLANNLDPAAPTIGERTYVRDRVADTTRVRSVSSTGAVVAGGSPAISSDGRYVAFLASHATVVPGDTNGLVDVFRRDTVGATTVRVNVADVARPAGLNAGAQRPELSDDGRYVVFESTSQNLVPGDGEFTFDLYWADRSLGAIQRVNVRPDGNRCSCFFFSGFNAAISGNGRYVVFNFEDTDLLPGDTNGLTDVFRRDMLTGVTQRITSSGGFAPVISRDGRYVAFLGSFDSIQRWDATTGTISTVLADASPSGFGLAMSRGGHLIAFSTSAPIDTDPDDFLPSDDTNGVQDVYLVDTGTGALERVSVGTGGIQGNGGSYAPAISDDGRYVSFLSTANNFVGGDSGSSEDYFLRDRVAGTTVRVAPSGSFSRPPRISANGRYVAFRSSSTSSLLPGATGAVDAYVFDALTGQRLRVSVDAQGRMQGGYAGIVTGVTFLPVYGIGLSADGGTVVFDGDGNPAWQVWAGYRPGPTVFAASVPSANLTFNPGSRLGTTGDGRDYVGETLATGAGLLVVGAPNGGPGDDGAGEVYVYALPEPGVAAAKELQQVAVLRNGGGQIGDKFGRGVAISPDGETIVVGAPLAGPGGEGYVFRKPPGGWTDDASPDDVLAPDAEDAESRFGESIAMDGDGNILVGAPDADVGGAPDHGVAYVFTNNAVTRLAPPASAGARFGSDLALDRVGDTLVVGAPDAGAGEVHVYRNGPTGPLAQGKFTAAGGQIGDKFGAGVAVDDGMIVVGAPGRGGGRGGATLFVKPPAGMPTPVATLTVDLATGSGSQAGSAVAIRDGLVLLGAPAADVDGRADQGRAFVYEEPDSGWSGTLGAKAGATLPDGAAGDEYGRDVAIGPGQAYVGVPRRDVEGAAAAKGVRAINVDQGIAVGYTVDVIHRAGFE